MEDREREALCRRAQAGDRARAALGELESWRAKKEASLLAELKNAKTPDEAFAVACSYRALKGFFSEAAGFVAIGESAAKELMKEE
jgi:hypothetical protein